MRTFTLNQNDGDGTDYEVAQGMETDDGRCIMTRTVVGGGNPEVLVFSSTEDLRKAYVDVPMSRVTFAWNDA
jgi:hypothetical protein